MSSKFPDLMATDRRLVLLVALLEAAGYEANSSALNLVLVYKGHRISQDLLYTDFAWLQEQGLAEVSEVAGLRIVKATQRGLDVASGAATVPGVKRRGLND